MSTTPKIVTIAEARAAGLTRYFNGRPCKHGHIAERLTSTSGCIVCHRSDWRRAKKRKPEEFRKRVNAAKKKAYYKDISKARLRTRLQNWRRVGIVPTRSCPGRCECCGGKSTGKGALHADHDKQTMVFRGWLCSKCNLGLGLLGDSVPSILIAVEYLLRAS